MLYQKIHYGLSWSSVAQAGSSISNRDPFSLGYSYTIIYYWLSVIELILWDVLFTLTRINIALYFALFPGVPRKTTEERDFGNFSIFEDPDAYYSTFNFHYPPKPFDRLEKLNEFNTLLGEQTIKDVMAECVRKRREGKAKNGTHNGNGTRNGTNGHW